MSIYNSEKLEILKKEVKLLNNKIKLTCESNEKLKNIYKGCIIYCSPLKHRPNYLFLGINPGTGFTKEGINFREKFDPEQKQYLGFTPWKTLETYLKTRNENLDSIVKTNCYFFSIYSLNNLNLFFKLLKKDASELESEVRQKSNEWIKTIINEISPKNIICFGLTVSNFLMKLYPEYTIIERKKNTCFVAKIDDIKVFSFHRRFGRSGVIKFIDKYIYGDYLAKTE